MFVASYAWAWNAATGASPNLALYLVEEVGVAGLEGREVRARQVHALGAGAGGLDEVGREHAVRADQHDVLEARGLERLRRDEAALGDEDREVEDLGLRRGDLGQRRAHVGLALGDGLLGDDLAAEGVELVGEDLLECLGVRAAVVDRGGLGALLVECPLGNGLALERVAVRRPQRSPRIPGRDPRRSAPGRVFDGEMVVSPASVRVLMPPTVSSEQAEPIRPTIVVSDASFWAAVAPPSGVHRPSSWVSGMSWSRSLPPLSSTAISTPRFESSPRVESAPERTPQYAMWSGSPAGTEKTPSSSDGAAAPPLQAPSARSAATPSAPTRMKRFKVFPPRDPIGPYTRPIMIECNLGPPRRAPGRTPDRRSSPSITIPSRTALQVYWCSTGDRIPLRAARRWPPKRCRIISVGEPNATPFGRAQHRRRAARSPVLVVVALVG